MVERLHKAYDIFAGHKFYEPSFSGQVCSQLEYIFAQPPDLRFAWLFLKRSLWRPARAVRRRRRLSRLLPHSNTWANGESKAKAPANSVVRSVWQWTSRGEFTWQMRAMASSTNSTRRGSLYLHSRRLDSGFPLTSQWTKAVPSTLPTRCAAAFLSFIPTGRVSVRSAALTNEVQKNPSASLWMTTATCLWWIPTLIRSRNSIRAVVW